MKFLGVLLVDLRHFSDTVVTGDTAVTGDNELHAPSFLERFQLFFKPHQQLFLIKYLIRLKIFIIAYVTKL